MKVIYRIAFFVAALLAVQCAGKKVLERGTEISLWAIDITPQQLVEKDGVVAFDCTLKLPAESFYRNLTVKMVPVIKFNGTNVPLEPIFLQGQSVETTDFQEVSYRDPFEMTVHYELPYEPDMAQAKIVMEMEGSVCGKARMASEMLVYSGGILPQPVPEPEVIVKPIVKHADMTGEIRAIIMFSISEDRISSGQDYMKYIRQNLDTVMSWPGAEITGIEFRVSCSPDGEAKFNEQLGQERYRAARQFYEKELDLQRFAAYQNPKITTHRIITQNWQGLYDLLEDSQIASRYDLIKNLKALPDGKREMLLLDYLRRYAIIKNQYLPLLRNAQLIIYYKTPWHEVKTRILPAVG